jgi:hypothetical protein
MKAADRLRGTFAGLLRSWFHLTPDEQKAVLLLVGLALLGLAVRAWHRAHGPNTAPPPAATESVYGSGTSR